MKTGLRTPPHMASRVLLTAMATGGLIGWTADGADSSAAAYTGQPATSVVAGTVHVVTRPSRRLASAGAYPGRIIGRTSEGRASELSNVVVYVRSAPARAQPTRVTIHQRDEEFVPRVVAITAGSTVDFPNDDLIFHNVFSLSHRNEFDLGRYPRGQSKSRTFAAPGLIKVFCHLHSHMSALIRVFDHPYFAVPDENGRFAISDVPAGSYQVVAWHERVGEVTLTVTIPSPATTRLAFSLPLADDE